MGEWNIDLNWVQRRLGTQFKSIVFRWCVASKSNKNWSFLATNLSRYLNLQFCIFDDRLPNLAKPDHRSKNLTKILHQKGARDPFQMLTFPHQNVRKKVARRGPPTDRSKQRWGIFVKPRELSASGASRSYGLAKRIKRLCFFSPN